MPVILELIENGRCLHYSLSEPWQIGEFTATFAEAKAALDRSPYPVHGLVNLLARSRERTGVLAIRKHPSFSHPNSGYVVFCNATMLARRVIETALTLAHFNRVKFFTTEAEGLAFLRALMTEENRTSVEP